MARRDFSEYLIAAAKSLLSVTDALGFDAQGAMWIYDHDLKYWRFYLINGLVEQIGSRKVYEMLLEVFERADFSGGIDLMDIYLRWPTDPLMQGLNALGETGPDGLARFRDQLFDGGLYDGVIVRRLRPELSEKETRAIGRRFAKNVRALRPAAE